MWLFKLWLQAPTALCSDECKLGYAKKISGIHKCCFNCELCLGGTHVNITSGSKAIWDLQEIDEV